MEPKRFTGNPAQGDQMSEGQKPKSVDVLGIAPYGEAVKSLAKGTVDGASAFLSRICLPAAEELGLLLQDQVRHWRSLNAARLAAIAEAKLRDQSESLQCPPRVALQILEKGSWDEDAAIQEMWGGLLASSCTESGEDDSNLVFIRILSHMTRLQARLLQFACESVKLEVYNDVFRASPSFVQMKKLVEFTGEQDVSRIAREIDDLRGHRLLNNAIVSPSYHHETENIGITSLGLQMYLRCKGSRQTMEEFALQQASGN